MVQKQKPLKKPMVLKQVRITEQTALRQKQPLKKPTEQKPQRLITKILKKKVVTNSKNGTTKTTNYEYGKNNQIKSAKIETTVKNAQTNKQEVVKRSEVTYNENGLSKTTIKTYDVNGRVSEKSEENAVTGAKKITTYALNENGKPESATIVDEKENEVSKISFKYDENGRRTSKVNTFTDDTFTSEEFTYSQDGKITKEVSFSQSGSVQYKEANSANQTKTLFDDKDFNGTIDSKTYFQEDAKGNTIKASYDDDNDGVYDVYDKFKGEDIISSEKIKKKYT